MSCTLCTIFAVVVQNVAFTNHSQFILAIFLLQRGLAFDDVQNTMILAIGFIQFIGTIIGILLLFFLIMSGTESLYFYILCTCK